MKKPTSQDPKYRTILFPKPMFFTLYCAGEGQVGGGYLVFHKTWVDVVLKPEAGWKQATKAKRRDSNKLKGSDGTWNAWFLLTRAFVLSRESIEEKVREIGAANTMNEAANQLRSAGKARAMAADARLHAILEAFANGLDIPKDANSTDYAFIAWFEERIDEKLDATDSEFIEAVNGFYRAARNLQKGYPRDVQRFSRVLREQATRTGGPPTKEDMRNALGAKETKSLAKSESVRASLAGEMIEIVSGAASSDIFDPDTLTRLLKRTGFSWLPNGKPGPRRKDKSGKGKDVEHLELNLPKRRGK